MASVLVDLRCLQDPDYAHRGVGQHVRSLLQGGRRERTVEAEVRLIGVYDLKLPALDAADRQLVDELRATAYVQGQFPQAFISTSPMTHSPLPFARLLADPGIVRVALGFDLIPLDLPERYLTTAADRLAYHICLAWLRRFDHHFAISHYTAGRLADVLGLASERLTVTGVAVRQGLIPPAGTAMPAPEPYILMVGGGDARKNPEVVIDAHAGSQLLNARGVELFIAGNYPEALAAPLRRRHVEGGGRPGLLQFLPKLPDPALRALYGSAACVVAPSRIEGFSIPVVEASANGAPVLASDCAAQVELLPHQDDLFCADDPVELRRKLETLIADPAVRTAALARQAGLWRRFVADEVAGRFWPPFLKRLDAMRPAQPRVNRGAKPRIAFLSPMPPAPSGVADYSRATLAELTKLADVELFTDTPSPSLPAGVRLVGPTAALAHVAPRFDRVVTVIGNSHFHVREFELLLRYGAGAIAHDARMLGFYAILLGEERALATASTELGRRVGPAELHAWLSNEAQMKTLFLGEIAAAALPMMVHSSITARFVAERHGVTCARLPFVPYRQFARAELATEARHAARQRLGLATQDIVLVSFGMVHSSKACEDCLWAVEMLRAWGFPARLALVGETDDRTAQWLVNTTQALGIGDAVVMFREPVPELSYRDWLCAADIGLQLRTYQLGGLSGALLDCLAAGLPTVSNRHLAEATEAPAFVRRVPDEISAVLVAEAVAGMIEEGLHRDRPLDVRDAILRERNFASYAARLVAALGLG